MLYSEQAWLDASRPDLDSFGRVLKTFCDRLYHHEKTLAKSTNALRWELKHYCFEAAPYILARFWKVYELPINGLTWPLWVHSRDVPTIQAAHGNDPALRVYLADRAKEWSSNYIATDLHIDVWAARVCLDLYGIDTPRYGNKPSRQPAAEVIFAHDGEVTSDLFARGFTVNQVATELGVTPKFLRAYWQNLHINPQFRLARARGTEALRPRESHSEIAVRREGWIASLKEGLHRGKVTRNIKSVGDAQHKWGVTYPTARARLVALGWTPGEGVDTWLAAQHEAE